MFQSQHSTSRAGPSAMPRRSQRQTPDYPAFFLRQLQRGERLFSPGERKHHFYRVESGSVSIALASQEGQQASVEIAKPNDFFGLGYLDRHIYTATADGDCMVSCWPIESLSFVLDQFPQTRSRQHDAMEREFAHRRQTLLAAAPVSAPAARLAAFLTLVSRLNDAEGRDAHIIGETMRSPVVADYLKLDIEELTDALLELHREGLVAAESGGKLRLLDVKKLKRFGAQAGTPAETSGHGA